ncbi:Inner-membrane proton/drug antiporter MSF type of tripartite multidrug efflux system [Citrifermentans bremense]|uniref:Inner-membrane proton/drug antiporter MSF type of tripartite multidrug efflux system n=1 Tax=Citrifermentans bremense TaxID=60035 RepID=A0A6S6LXZ1_9BACT|nr:DHA2 family efflux MFS transporter permease subunit [Citrifermentans bremense]BCG46882.1 Inner-membrane proton/drug antiporter MSF type of tripartite multidrug efflux system [Citrifermentans bremense]
MKSAEEKNVNKWLITITVMLPAIMEIVDTSVANVALPHMQGSLNAGTDEVTWVLTSYLVSNAVVLPMTGWLARMFGRKRFLITCITLFTLASLLCGAAPSLGLLIFFRVLQGAAGGALIPMSQAIMMETFPPYQQGMAMAIFGVGAMFGPIIGPALGGWITDNMSWRWIFYINIPIGVVAVIMASFFIYDPSYLKRTRVAIDYWGLALLTVGLGALQIVLDKGQQDDWFNSPFIVCCAVITAITLTALVYVELTHPHPIVNLRLFKNVSFSSGNLIMFAVGFCLYSSIMLIPLFLQTLMGYNATMAGMVLAPGGVATLICMPFVGAAIQRYDGRKVVFIGLIISAISMFIMQHFTLQAAYSDFVWPRVVLGVGLAMIFVPLTTVTLATISKEEMGNATGIFSLLRNIGGSVGIAIAATMLARYSQFYQTSLVAHVTPYNPVFQSQFGTLKGALMGRGLDAVAAEKGAMTVIYGTVNRQAYMLSYNRIFFIVGLAFLIIIPLLFLLKKPAKHLPPPAH